MSTARDHRAAARRYAKWVAAAPPDSRLWDQGLRQQIYLGGDAFVARMQALPRRAKARDANGPKTQRATAKAFADWLRSSDSVDEAVYRGHREGGLTLTAMARELDRTVSWASKVLARYEREGMGVVKT